jgi:hypothetical protein
MAFDDYLRARVTRELKSRVLRLLKQPEHRGRDEADLLRIAIEDFCDQQEQLLHMKPITDEEVQEMTTLLLAERGRPAPPAPAPEKKVTYHQKPRKLPGHRN